MTTLNQQTIIDQLESKEEFPINLSEAGEWLGYARKDHAVRAFISLGMSESVDYQCFPTNGENPKSANDNRSVEYRITVDAFKMWAMGSRTKKGKEVRMYYIGVEKEWKASKHAVLENPNALAYDRLQAQIALEFEKDVYRPWSSQNRDANVKFRTLVGIPILEPVNVTSELPATVKIQGPEIKPLLELINTLSLSNNRNGLAFNKHLKTLEIFVAQYQNSAKLFQSEISRLEEENIRLKAKNKTLQNELRDEVEQLISDCDQELEEIKVNAAKEVDAGIKKAEKTFRKAYFDHLDIEVTKLREGVQKLTKRNPDRDDAIDIKFWSR
jgi:phage anti-repressor protein